ncbi:uncharacterized protein LOC141851225 [Brevipalpus obovatus]|uniref:uncharacterized protein LOC141851225 n=1 Tax=Brevipalpus obovatus TaxID=246614 RepID=UPI003D9F30A2
MAESETNNNNNNSSSDHRRRRRLDHSLSHDSALIFDIEGLDIPNHELKSSDQSDCDDQNVHRDDSSSEDSDIEDDIDDDDTTDVRISPRGRDSKYVSQFSASLPIQVPLWKTSNHVLETEDDSHENITLNEDPNKIAESFRALAWSVKDDTEMFGDLPRRRLNTGDLVRSRPI